MKQYAEIDRYQNISFQWTNRNGLQNGIENIFYSAIVLKCCNAKPQHSMQISKNIKHMHIARIREGERKTERY